MTQTSRDRIKTGYKALWIRQKKKERTNDKNRVKLVLCVKFDICVWSICLG